MSWKDYLYFQKGDKIAIILLLILIVISGGVYIVTRPNKLIKKEEVTSDSENEFELFLSSLQDREEDKNAEVSPTPSPSHHYPYQKKLKTGETIELNSADTSVLKTIPKIGSGYANRIVKYREALGGYIDISQLKEVWGMDDYLYSDILPYITLESKNRRISVNAASFQELNNHPYLSYKQAQLIVDLRERKGNISSLNRLSLLDEFSDRDIKRLTPYLSFD